MGKNIVLYEEKNFLLYQLLNFEIYENSVIFCNTHTLKSLFNHLYKINNLKNIKLITHQTDIEINEKLLNSNQNVFLSGILQTLVLMINL